MNLIAIDSACSVLSIAVSRDDEIHYTETEAGSRQSEIAMDCMDSLMKKASLKPQELNGILCMGGPGSFTGLRIGYSIAKGLALSLSIPFVPIPTLDCIAYQSEGNEEREKKNEKIEIRCERLTENLVLAVIEARKGAFYYAFFQSGKRLTPDTDGTTEQIAAAIKEIEKGNNITLTGPAASLFYDALPPEPRAVLVLDSECRGYAKELILIAKDKNLFDNDNTAYLYSGPEYVRKTDAELSLLQN